MIIEEKMWLKKLFTKYLKELGLENAEQVGEMLLVLHEGIVVTYPMSLTPSGIDSAKETAKEMIETSMKR